jgi:5-methylcytosine-specific restriction endonuclease McrA
METKKQKLKRWRTAFREGCLKRDGYKCKVCNASGTDVMLDVHHIRNRKGMENDGYVLENGITLCDNGNSCHLKAEQWHISGGANWEPGFHPDDLYKLIGSSLEDACRASGKLK